MSDDLAACARLLARGDPARLRATLAAPIALRRMLLPLYAFNLEVARAPWVTREPLIAQMRLQWWADALAEIAAGGPARRHEVVTPLAAALDPRGAHDLGDLVEARRADVADAVAAHRETLLRYLDRTAGTLLWTAARIAGAGDEAALRDAGRAQGIAAWLRAVPDLAARGREALPPGDAVAEGRALAAEGLEAWARFRQGRVPPPARPVLLVLADVPAILRHAARHGSATEPGAVASRLRLARAILGRGP